MRRKTKTMLATEEKIGQPLEEAIPEMVTEFGIVETSKSMGVSKATLSYWILKFGFTTRRVVTKPGERLVAVDKFGNERKIG